MTDPARIYLQPECCATNDGRMWCRDDEPVECPDGESWTAYVLAPTDESIRALVRIVAQATVELVTERLVLLGSPHAASGLARSKHELASMIATATMADADEDPEAPLNALRGRV